MPAAHFSNSERQQKVSHNTISSLNLPNPPCVRTKLRKYHRWSPYCNTTTHRKCPLLLVPKTPCTKGPHSTYRLIWESLSSRTIFSFKPRSSDSSPSIVPAQATTPSFSLLYSKLFISDGPSCFWYLKRQQPRHIEKSGFTDYHHKIHREKKNSKIMFSVPLETLRHLFPVWLSENLSRGSTKKKNSHIGINHLSSRLRFTRFPRNGSQPNFCFGFLSTWRTTAKVALIFHSDQIVAGLECVQDFFFAGCSPRAFGAILPSEVSISRLMTAAWTELPFKSWFFVAHTCALTMIDDLPRIISRTFL